MGLVLPTLALCVAMLGCVSALVVVPINFRLVDHPSEGRIELRYRNDTGRILCISDSDWPNQGGKLNQANDVAFLVAGGERFPVKYFNTGYCVGDDCVKRVAPGEEISGWISYGDFSLPEQYWSAPKKLDFSPTAYVCKAK
jgi:hypothetical protein